MPSKSLGLFVSQVVFPYFILNHILHLSQQLTPDEEDGLCLWGAVVLSSLFNSFLKQFQQTSIKAAAFVPHWECTHLAFFEVLLLLHLLWLHWNVCGSTLHKSAISTLSQLCLDFFSFFQCLKSPVFKAMLFVCATSQKLKQKAAADVYCI